MPATTSLIILLHVSLQLLLIMRVLLRPYRDPAARVAWTVVVATMPVMGMLAYLLLGEVSIGRRRMARLARIQQQLPPLPALPHTAPPTALSATAGQLFRIGQSISGFAPSAGNRAELMPDSDSTIDHLVADIDAARHHAHLLFYIWLPDNNGSRVAQALMRAAQRGLSCRVLVDDVGSRLLLRSPLWQQMQDAGVKVAATLPVGNPLLRPFSGRIDLRNHRKIVVIDHYTGYCGSQNCADPEFRIKPRFAPWVDAVIRVEGTVVQQMQRLFVTDWMLAIGEDLLPLLTTTPAPPPEHPASGLLAQVIGTGPTARHSAMPELFVALMYSAQHRLTITTPYYVPDEALQSALCAAAQRGVATTLQLPARNDSLVVSAASRSYYAELLAAGVVIAEYHGGLLHSKLLTVDEDICLIGSANLDRRSFELNYENNLLCHDRQLTTALHQRQQQYLQHCSLVEPDSVAAWPLWRRLWNNAIAMLGPLL
ncbi:cardiolipin synthase [Aquitalea sp. LB_tupeE]|uniref:cardiolipin synthase n=1 Tax=Aquitalea sp. LB_tupeE TaxID=2748078 RepID=UPI001C4B99F4|nr:cardiolipin synthase [Aquitalea sp. LB_tupeE]